MFAVPLRNEFPVVLIAGGIGITPFMSFLESLRGSADEPNVTLLYGCRSAADHAFLARIAELSAALPNLKVSTFYTRPGAGDACDVFGRMTAADIPAALIEERARFYLCGPEAMMDQVTEGLVARGVFRFEIFRERFQSRLPVRTANESPHVIRFARSGREVTWTAKTGSILACAESAGMSLPSGCEVGQCESCAVPILSGEVFYATDFPGAEDGVCLTCQAIPISDLVLNA
jgi:ferredoxin-NADP reductase